MSVLLNLAASATRIAVGQLAVGNATTAVFTASGLDLGTIDYAEGFAINVKYK
jgi:hypothetical protein